MGCAMCRFFNHDFMLHHAHTLLLCVCACVPRCCCASIAVSVSLMECECSLHMLLRSIGVIHWSLFVLCCECGMFGYVQQFNYKSTVCRNACVCVCVGVEIKAYRRFKMSTVQIHSSIATKNTSSRAHTTALCHKIMLLVWCTLLLQEIVRYSYTNSIKWHKITSYN